MSLESASFVAQIVGGIAVVLSLLYVGVQIRQNTKATMMTAAQSLQATIGNIEELMITDSHFSELILRWMQREELSPVDRWRMTLMCRNVLRSWQTGHYMYRTGVLDKALWEPQAVLLAGLMAQDQGFQAHFDAERATLDPVFVGYVEKIRSNAVPFEAVPRTKSSSHSSPS
jgi:hypothetical protein